MLARVTTWEGGSADEIRGAAEEMRSSASQGPPEGVKSTGLTMLVDPEGGRIMMIGMFETADDLQASEPALQAMTPPPGLGRMTAKDIYTVGMEVRV